ncbi:MAG TPA: methyltransferase domain-containing protein [Pilimelia sp.]|nr:methyltransferase domain-containing protein [Pilimelia sp.]
MLLDEPRMTAFRDAIDQVVEPGNHVVDLGTGTGVLSFFAARRGARVTAVEREPRVLAAARQALAGVGDQVRLVHADARDYLPDEPVDVVLCEMMHVGQLRERQVEVIDSFKRRYAERFGDQLPRFVPEACVQAAQPVAQDFSYLGYTVAAPVFQEPYTVQPRTTELAGPQVFQRYFYRDPLPPRCTGDLRFTAARAGRLNAVRIITKNLLAVRLAPPSSVDWLMSYLVAPLTEPVEAAEGDEVRIRFDYRPGDEIDALTGSLRADVAAYAGSAGR